MKVMSSTSDLALPLVTETFQSMVVPKYLCAPSETRLIFIREQAHLMIVFVRVSTR